MVGGTSFAGGIGTIPGAVLGAFVMASLAYGLAFLGVNSPIQSIVAGIVLVVAVGFDYLQSPARRQPTRGTMMTDERRVPLVEMRNISVAFGGVHAVDDVTIDLHAGEVVGLVGGNGAGKTTLMRTLSGAHPADSGEILIDGQPLTIGNTRDAKNLKIETIYQTLALADNIGAPGNVFLGRELTTRWGTLDDGAMENATREVMARLNPNFTNFTHARDVALRRAAPGRGHRPGGLLQRPDPHHGRAHGGARSG